MFKVIDGELGEFASSWDLWRHFNMNDVEDPLILVIGAYQGKVMHLMLELFEDAEVIGFEPQHWACERIVQRLVPLEQNERWKVHAYGLGDHNELEVEMGEFSTDACSFVNVGPGSREHGFGHMVDAVDALDSLGKHVDLVIMNIEGYEYQLLNYLLKTGYLTHFDRLAVQFHNNLGFGTTEGDMDVLIDLIISTGFNPVVDQRPTWVYWER